MNRLAKAGCIATSTVRKEEKIQVNNRLKAKHRDEDAEKELNKVGKSLADFGLA